jgi:uncharacterized protein
LVHASALADKCVKDPREVVRVGQTVQVRVVEVDIARKRIALSMRKDDGTPRPTGGASGAGAGRPGGRTGKPAAAPQGAMAEAFARLRKG